MQIPAVTKPSRRPLTPWELPQLLTPMHAYRKSRRRRAVDRPHFAPILSFVYRNRFAVASQIQRRFPQYLRSDRTARRHLEELEHLGYLAVAPTRSTSPLWPKVYFVTKRGLKKLGRAYAATGKTFVPTTTDRRRPAGYSADHILHEVLTTEFLLNVWQTVQERPDLELLTVQRRSLAKYPAFRVTIDGKPGRLIPDAMFLFRQRGNGMISCFLEMDVGTMTVQQIETKYRRYAAFAHSEFGQRYLSQLYETHGAANARPNFRIVVAVLNKTGTADDGRVAKLLALARSAGSRFQDRLWITTVQRLCERQHNGLPLAEAIWARGRDVSPANSWNLLPRHTLFPQPRPLK